VAILMLTRIATVSTAYNSFIACLGISLAGRLGQEWIMAKLTAAKKNAEPKKEFGLPAERKYPMPDANHARNAKARASQMEHQGKLSAADKKKIDTKADHILNK
jgi:hypothetical protein